MKQIHSVIGKHSVVEHFADLLNCINSKKYAWEAAMEGWVERCIRFVNNKAEDGPDLHFDWVPPCENFGKLVNVCKL